MALINTQANWWDLWILRRGEIMNIADNLGLQVDELGDKKTSTAFDMNEATNDRDHKKIHDFMEMLWAKAPDKPIIHTWLGWAEMCDLCSEYWVFDSYEDISKGGP